MNNHAMQKTAPDLSGSGDALGTELLRLARH